MVLVVCFALLGMKPRTLNMLSKYSPLSTPQPGFTFFFFFKQPWLFSELESGNLKTNNPFVDSKDRQ